MTQKAAPAGLQSSRQAAPRNLRTVIVFHSIFSPVLDRFESGLLAHPHGNICFLHGQGDAQDAIQYRNFRGKYITDDDLRALKDEGVACAQKVTGAGEARLVV